MNTFHPKYTYTFFGDTQTIRGYTKAAVDIYIRDDTCKLYIKEELEGKAEDVFIFFHLNIIILIINIKAVDPVAIILSVLSPCKILTNADSFFEVFFFFFSKLLLLLFQYFTNTSPPLSLLFLLVN
jgi:hypothetical protein